MERKRREPDFISMACTSASVCYREVLTPDELVQALTSGEVSRNRFPHFRMLFEEAPEVLLHSLVEQMARRSTARDRAPCSQTCRSRNCASRGA